MADIALDLVAISERKCIYFDNLCFSVSKPEKVDVLKNLHGCFYPGRLCAIVGPSGAGKTSLLNILSGFKKPSADSVFLVNGEKVSQNCIRKNSAYIAQDITFLGKLTMKETLEYAAEFKLPTDIAKSSKLTIIEDIVKLLGLEKCLHNHVEKLSGGEKKRLAIGEELITNPPVMIFDEPTSGLDSVSSVQIIRHLMDLAHKGRTVICVIHQPSSFVLELFDDIYVLSNGQCLYNGRVEDIVPRFQEAGFICPQYYNRSDFILEVASQQRQGDLEFLISKAKQNEEMNPASVNGIHSGTFNSEQLPEGSMDDLKLIPSNSYALNQWKQFCILLARAFLCNRRDITVIQLKLVVYLVCGLLLGLTYYDIGNDATRVLSNLSYMYILMTLIFFANSIPVILLYPLDAKIFHREYLNNRYAFFPYFYAKIMADIPIAIICTFVTVIPSYFLCNQPAETYRFFLFSLVYCLLSINALFCGFAIGIIFGIKMGIFFLPAICTPMFLYSGFLVRDRELPIYLKPLSYMSILRYSMRGSIQSIYGFNREGIKCEGFPCFFKSPSEILKEIDIMENTFMLDILGMLVWLLVFKIIAIFGLKRQLRKLLN